MKRCVLIIDDDVHLCQELSDLFRKKKISVLTAGSGRASLEIADNDPFDVALVDVCLPDCDGIELVARLRKKRPESAFLLVTAYASLESAIKAVHYGVLEYIPKPFHPEDVFHAVERGFAARDAASYLAGYGKKLTEEKSVLEKKVNGLERLNDIYLGREGEIMALKREVNSLLRAMNRDVKYEDC